MSIMLRHDHSCTCTKLSKLSDISVSDTGPAGSVPSNCGNHADRWGPSEQSGSRRLVQPTAIFTRQCAKFTVILGTHKLNFEGRKNEELGRKWVKHERSNNGRWGRDGNKRWRAGPPSVNVTVSESPPICKTFSSIFGPEMDMGPFSSPNPTR